jgi:hypothetical protein
MQRTNPLYLLIPALVLMVVAVLLIVGMILPARGTPVRVENGSTLYPAIADEGPATATDGFGVQVSGALQLQMPPGSAFALGPGASAVVPTSWIGFINLDNGWGIYITLAGEITPRGYTLRDYEQAIITGGASANVSSLAEDSPVFNQDLTGSVNIDAVSDSGISGSFQFTATAQNGQTISVTGTFADVPYTP